MEKLTAISLAVLLGVLGLSVHAGAMPQQSPHAMSGMDHSTSTSSCSTVRNLTTQHKDEFADEINEDDDDNPSEPYYVQFQISPLSVLTKDHNQRTKVATNREPPPGMPAYITLAVFRA